MLATYAGNGFQMYVGVGGQVNYKGAGNQSGDVAIKDSKGTAVTLTADKTYTFSVSHYGNITKYSVYDSDKNLLGVAQHTNATWSGTVSVLSTGVGGTYGTFNNNMLANGWSLPSGYIIPEPATATLSLLALCGLTMRRRRK